MHEQPPGITSSVSVAQTPYLNVSRHMGSVVAILLVVALVLYVLKRASGGRKGK